MSVTQDVITNFTIGNDGEIEGNFDGNSVVMSDGVHRMSIDLEHFDILVEAYEFHKRTQKASMIGC